MADTSRKPKLPVPSRVKLAGMTESELDAAGLAYLKQHNGPASSACLRELQRRTGPLGLKPRGEPRQ